MGYGESIKAARKAAGFTQEQLAKKCSMATVTIRQYESEKREPRKEQLQILAEALGVEPWQLMGYKEIRIPMPEYPICSLTREQFDVMSQAEQEHYVLRLFADTDPDRLSRQYIDNYNKLNKLGQVEAVRRTKELTQLKEYTEPDKHRRELTIRIKKKPADAPQPSPEE